MNSYAKTSSLAAALVAVGISFGSPGIGFADVNDLPSCGPEGANCAWSIEVDGQEVAGGTYSVDDEGQIGFQGQRIDLEGGGFVQLTGLNGNIDPILGFNASAGTGAAGKTFAFNFSLPIALSGPIDASSNVGYTLTSLSAAGAQIAPLFGHVVVAQEVDTSVGGLPPLNKGVDVGDTFFFVGGPATQLSQYSASNSFAGNLAYDLMSVTVAFSLSAQSQVGISGFVQQTPVPEPSTYLVLIAGLAFIGVIARRRLS